MARVNLKKHTGWQFRREITLGTVLHVLALLVMLVTAWNDLQNELMLIRQDLARIIESNIENREQIRDLSQLSDDFEIRLRDLERIQAGDAWGDKRNITFSVGVNNDSNL